MPRCPQCGVPDYADLRVLMHKAVIYHCSNCGHSWKRERPRELNKEVPPIDEDICVKFKTCNARLRECVEGDFHPDCFVNVENPKAIPIYV